MKLNNNYQDYWKSIGLLFPLLLTGCSDELSHLSPTDMDGRQKIELGATIDQVNDTRADESGFADQDRFGVFVVNYDGDVPGQLTLTDNQANNVAFTYSADNNSWQASTDIYWRDNVTPADVYGYYPFNNGMGDVDAYRFEVEHDQSIAEEGEMGHYEASDLLWAKASRALPGKKVSLTFNHILAGVKVTLQQGSGFDGDSWNKLTKTVTVDNTIRTASVDLSKGTAIPNGELDRNVVMNTESGDTYRAVVVPQSVASGKNILSITIDGVSYQYKPSAGMTYTAGKLHNFTMKVDRKTDGSGYSLTLVSEEITPWEADQSSHDFVDNAYQCVNCPEAGKLRDALNNARIDFNTIKNLKVTGTLTTEDFYLMRDELLSLSALNLKDVQVVNVKYWQYDENGVGIGEIEENNIIPPDAFCDKNSLRRIILPDGLKKIGGYAFHNLALNSTVIIPESVTHLYDGAFSGIREGCSIVMPHHLEYIGGDAFYECKASIEVILTNTIKSIGTSAFWGATNAYGTFSLPNKLEYLGRYSLALGNNFDGEIIIPETLTEIPESAFSGLNLKGGTKVTFHDGITKIGRCAFDGISFGNGFKLPPYLKEIGEDAFYGCHFMDELDIPETVQIIGTRAFADTNLKGEFSVPNGIEMISPTPLGECGYALGSFANTQFEKILISDNVEIIGGRAFYANDYLRELEIGKNVDRIGMEAFAYCPGLQRVVCLAKEPPKLYDNVFIGFDPLHCHLEVPEESVDLYKRADGWKDFQFISPHRELTFGLYEQACLNNGITRSAILYSEGKWKVKESPSWIHVTPDHADYKEEVTITVDKLASGSGTRTGKVVFELEGKDYTIEFEITQYDYETIEDTEISLQKASCAGNPINLFIVGDGFGAEEIVDGTYLSLMNETMEHFFSIEPYKSYRSYFNVMTSIAMSPDNKVATLQNRKSDRLKTYGVDLDIPVVKNYVCDVSESITTSSISDALIIVVSNMDGFNGKAYPDEDGCALACISISSDVYPYDMRGLVQHYAGGKAFAGLAVEYISHNEHIKGCTCPYCNGLPEYNIMKGKGMFENISLTDKLNDVPWSDFIFHPKYSAIVDIWQGGFNHLLGVWRSESQSVMGTYISYYNTISRYAIYKAIMRRAGLGHSLEQFIANDKIEQPAL